MHKNQTPAAINYLGVQQELSKHQRQKTLITEEALQSAIFNSANFSSIATDAKGVIQIFNVGAERMLGYAASEVMNKITPADISDPQEVVARAKALSLELGTPIAPGFEALVFKASRGIEDIYKLTYIRKDGSRFPAVVSVTALRDEEDVIIGYLLIGTDNTARKKAEDSLIKAGALQNAIFNSANFSSIATDAKGVIQIFNVGAERMLGYAASEVMNKITPADISDPQEVVARAKALSLELGTPIAPGFDALVFKASRGIEDIYELTYIRKDGSRFPAVVSVTALRDTLGIIIGYLLIGTDNTARQQAEAGLLRAGALQNAIFNSANFSSIATDAMGVIQIFNVGAERMLGYAASEVMNKITPADISDPQEVVARAKALSLELGTSIAPGFEALVFKASRGIKDIYELTYIRKDGSRFPAVVSVTALRDEKDVIIGYLLIGTDNTARKRAEDALIKAGALQNAIFNSANFSSIATDAKGVIQIFNVGAERMLGYAASEVMNKITPADISDPQEVVARAKALSLELGTPIAPGFEALVFKASRGIEDIYELTYIRKDGSRFPAVVSVTALRDALGIIIGYLLIGTDNTARKQIEEERTKLDQRLRDQQFYTRSLIESNIDAIITTDPQGIITDVNKQMEALTACTRDELIGAPFKRHFTDPQRAEAAIKQVLLEGKLINYELTALSREKRETVVSYNATIFYDRDRRPQGVFAAARDITERKVVEHALQTSELFTKSTLDAASSPICVLNETGEILAVNQAWRDFSEANNGQSQHMSFNAGIGSNYLLLCQLAAGQDAAQAAMLATSIGRVIMGESRELTLEYSVSTAAEKFWFIARVTRFHGDSGNVVVAHENISARKLAELRENQQHQVLQLLAAKAPLDMVLSTIARDVEAINQTMLCSIELFDKEGKHLRLGAAPSLPDYFKAALGGCSLAGELNLWRNTYSGDQRLSTYHKDPQAWHAAHQTLITLEGIHANWAQPILSAQGLLLGTFTIYQHGPQAPSHADLQLVEDQARLVAVAIEKTQAETHQRLAASVFSHVREAIMITDAAGVIVEVNETFSRITGHSQTEAAGQHMRMLSSNQQIEEFFPVMWQELVDKGHWNGELLKQRKNGEEFAAMLTISAVRSVGGATQNYVALFSDITLMKEHAQQLEHIAHYDSLTGLPNRVLLADRLEQAIALCKRRGSSLAVVFLDLDHFKAVNDGHGHTIGDELLVTLAQRMKATLRSGDTLARLGGDEFVGVLVDMESPNDYEPVLQRLLEAASSPVSSAEHVLRVSASIGVTVYPNDEGDADLLIRHADQAMYAAKQLGRNRHHLFDLRLDEAIQTRNTRLERIRLALENQEFVLFYQPKVNMRTHKVVGAEALIRWQHPERGILSPAEFLPLIEGHPLSVNVGEWVIETALQQLSDWQRIGLSIPVSVNIGARQLQEDEFEPRLATALKAHSDVPPRCLELEVLETSALEDMEKVSRVMLSCCEMGVSFLLDDFGTGYSSLTHLKRLPADVIKIDQSFVRDMLDDADDLAIVKGIVALATSFRIEVVAEGVETQAHGDMLVSIGCNLAQGYGIAWPMPAAQFPEWVQGWQAKPVWTA